MQPIASDRQAGNTDDRESYVVNANGTGVSTPLTNTTASDAYPAWSLDGMKIVFVSNRAGNYEIYVMNANGSGVTRLTNNSALDLDPAWGANGSNEPARTRQPA
jgi:Tol biopolymer transport system component